MVDTWEKSFEREITAARSARNTGNEGRARVCARRAAGIVINEYLRVNNHPIDSSNAYDIIKIFSSQPDLPNNLREISEHFLERVNQDFQLSGGIDLIYDAVWLKDKLLSP